MKKIFLFALLMNLCLVVFAQNEGAYFWKELSKVTFKTNFDAETGNYQNIPVFSKQVKGLAGQRIILKGYIIPVSTHKGAVILSAFPYSNCYFCGGAGPETVVEVYPNKPLKPNSKPLILEGELELNESDPLHLCYILREADIYGE